MCSVDDDPSMHDAPRGPQRHGAATSVASEPITHGLDIAALTRAIHALSHDHADLWSPDPLCGCEAWARAIAERYEPAGPWTVWAKDGEPIATFADEDAAKAFIADGAYDETAILAGPQTGRVALYEPCSAVLWHGPGHQSRTLCVLRGPHAVHATRYGDGQEMEWRDHKAFTGYFDEPVPLPRMNRHD